MSVLVRCGSLGRSGHWGWVGSMGRALHGPPIREEYRSEPVYPPIKTFRNTDEEELANLKDTLHSLKTVEEKQYYLNKPKYFGWPSYQLSPRFISYGSLEFIQAMTDTRLVEGWPDSYQPTETMAQDLARVLAPKLARVIQDCEKVVSRMQVPNDRIYGHESHAYPKDESRIDMIEWKLQQRLRVINRFFLNHLLGPAPHLLGVQVDHDPRVEAFWFRSGMDPDVSLIRKRKGLVKYLKKVKRPPWSTAMKPSEDYPQQPGDQVMQSKANPHLVHRHPGMIAPFIGQDHDLCQNPDQVPTFTLAPRTLGYIKSSKAGVNLPGCWTGSNNIHASLLLLSPVNVIDYRQVSQTIHEEQFGHRQDMLASKLILTGFTQLLAQACFLGYEPMNNVQEPLATQAVVTDGLKWKLAAYQLNRTALLDEAGIKHPNNVCWQTPEQDLFKSNEETGQSEINLELLTQIIQVYLRTPDLLPTKTAKCLHDIQNDYNRNYFFKEYRTLCSRRLPALQKRKPIILPHEQLFKIRHKEQMFMDGNRDRPWFQMARTDFLGKEHWHPEFKHLDHYDPYYKPRKFRSHKKDRTWKKVVAPIPDEE
eukprot:maker-scaffold49_size462716-snap-gene-1.22 protein:Tk03615 transcript:maker-scaffold49_size462716-snap-gene-1.22-mRNA-1 annotation:"28s ribosomal protein mitochondrial"